MPRYRRFICPDCQQPCKREGTVISRCLKCAVNRQKARGVASGQFAAHQAVSAAVRRGELQPARERACVDCGKPARDYEHRDYSKPLDVQPTCRSCNIRRGPAIWRPEPTEAARA